MSEEYEVTITGPGLNFKRSIEEALAGQIMGLLMSGAPVVQGTSPTVTQETEKPTKKKSGSSSKRRSSTRKQHVPSMVKELDLSGGPENPSLEEFFEQYQTSNNFERNVLFVYYLEKIISTEKIDYNHVYTCYRYLNRRSPSDPYQSLIRTAHEKGWLDTSNLLEDGVKITTLGENAVEHDIPRKEIAN